MTVQSQPHHQSSPGYVFNRLNQARAVLHNHVSLSERLGFALWSNQDDFTSYQKPEHHTLSLYLSGGYQTKRLVGSQALGGGAPGKLCIMPIGHESYWQVDGQLSFVHLYFSNDELSDCVEQNWDKSAMQLSLQDLTFIDDPAMTSLLQHWALNLNWQDASDQLALQQVSQLLFSHLVKNYSNKRLADSAGRGGLAPFQLQRCQDYIEQNLAEQISLQQLAGLVDLSPYHFARMFKLSSGLSPHQYLTQRRIVRAKLLLSSGDLSLTTLAYQLGFSSQAHFSARFKHFTGQSPLAYRRSQRA